ncbi:hypothetical protein BpHYR1_029535 [Brachionus plicatilis]|uniref:HAT C-terminal dimerisation domain-containing protein n=1 Tax=Brachionus plicatilis TaxID=10195 RepID=A0A3M7RA77_BRAPC|nr:hypothetical protein BpHYR1_029535 [Brachionus plicatilis]
MKQLLFHLLRKSAKYVQILQNCTLFKSIENKTQLICTYFADLRSRTKVIKIPILKLPVYPASDLTFTLIFVFPRRQLFCSCVRGHNLLCSCGCYTTTKTKNQKIFKKSSMNTGKIERFNKSQFPILSSLASVVLAIPATSVPSERFFSHAGYQLWDRRYRMSKKNFEKIIIYLNNLNRN